MIQCGTTDCQFWTYLHPHGPSNLFSVAPLELSLSLPLNHLFTGTHRAHLVSPIVSKFRAFLISLNPSTANRVYIVIKSGILVPSCCRDGPIVAGAAIVKFYCLYIISINLQRSGAVYYHLILCRYYNLPWLVVNSVSLAFMLFTKLSEMIIGVKARSHLYLRTSFRNACLNKRRMI